MHRKSPASAGLFFIRFWQTRVMNDHNRLRRTFASLLLATVPLFSQSASAGECVVVLHGLGRTSASMSNITSALRKHGYLVVTENYPSRSAPVAELSAVVGKAIQSCRSLGATRVSFVTHSLGGILVRVYFQTHEPSGIGKVVMLAPPNHGSEIVDAYADKWWYRSATGPAGQQLGTHPDELIAGLRSLPLEVGVIAGNKSADPWFSSVMPGPNDGKVSVRSARLEGMKDFIVVPYSHTFMAKRAKVVAQVLAFLAKGKFDHADAGS
jgi:triacylglycerol lipase